MSIAGFALEEWQIRLVLPHRPPVLQLDRVTSCSPAFDRLEANKAVAGGDTMVVQGTWPAALAPAAVIEALAQCCGLLLRLRWLAHDGADLHAFAAGDGSQVLGRDIPRSVLAESEVRFKLPFAPGQMLLLATTLVLSRGDMHRFEAAAQSQPVEPEHRNRFCEAGSASARIMLNFPRLTTPPPVVSGMRSTAENPKC